jgi:succinate dehydrogenase/fumarate reductase flavoprotein subunit
MTQTKKVSGVATKVSEDGADTIVKYHNTEVVRFNSKRIVLNTGGYETMTTRRRMNQASNQFDLGYSVYSKKGDTLVDFKGVTIPFNGTVLTLER